MTSERGPSQDTSELRILMSLIQNIMRKIEREREREGGGGGGGEVEARIITYLTVAVTVGLKFNSFSQIGLPVKPLLLL